MSGPCWSSRTAKSPDGRRSSPKSRASNQHEHPDAHAHPPVTSNFSLHTAHGWRTTAASHGCLAGRDLRKAVRCAASLRRVPAQYCQRPFRSPRQSRNVTRMGDGNRQRSERQWGSPNRHRTAEHCVSHCPRRLRGARRPAADCSGGDRRRGRPGPGRNARPGGDACPVRPGPARGGDRHGLAPGPSSAPARAEGAGWRWDGGRAPSPRPPWTTVCGSPSRYWVSDSRAYGGWKSI